MRNKQESKEKIPTTTLSSDACSCSRPCEVCFFCGYGPQLANSPLTSSSGLSLSLEEISSIRASLQSEQCDELEPAPSPGSKRKHGDDGNSFDGENPCSEPSRSSRPFFALQPPNPEAIRGSLPKRTASIDCKKATVQEEDECMQFELEGVEAAASASFDVIA